MKKDDENSIWNWVALAGMAAYLFWIARKNGNTLQGNPMGYKVRVDPDLMVDMILTPLNMNPYLKLAARHGAKKALGALGSYGIQEGQLR